MTKLAQIFAMGVIVSALSADFKMSTSPQVQAAIRKAVDEIVKGSNHTNLDREIAISVVNLTDAAQPQRGSYRGDVRIYPASVIKLFYLEAAHRWMEDGKISDTPELRRAMRDMIEQSYNEATHYVIDVITGTSSGQELLPGEMKEWEWKRNAINRYFAERGFTNINANQKPWGEGPYGRERVFVGEKYTNRNMLTTDATARLMTEIVLGKSVSANRSAEMLQLMERDPFSTNSDPDSQAHGFIGSSILRGSKIWSKAGWTSQTRHDAAYIEFPNGKKVVLVIFTVNHAHERELIPKLARAIFSNMELGTYESPKNVGGETVR